MATAIRVSDETKALLDRLQARVTLETGAKPTLGDLVEQLATLGFEERERLERGLGLAWGPMTEDEVEAWQRDFVQDWGVETREDDIDRALYEESA